MPLTNGAYLQNPTIAVTGGTSRNLLELSDQGGKKELAEDNGAGILDRKLWKCSVTMPKQSATAANGYTQMRNEVVLIQPFTPSGGTRTTNTIRLSVSVDAALSATEKRVMINDLISFINDADVNGFFVNGSLA